MSPTTVSPQWIISKTEDMTWFIGSALVSYLALALMTAGFPLAPLMFVWLLGVDGPHVLATVTRTYCDREQRAKLGALLWIPIPLLLIGPLMTLAGYASLFYLFAVCWQHFHIVKQHFGFVMLYKAKNRERDRIDFHLDRWFLLGSLFLPLMIFIARTQNLVIHSAVTPWILGVASVAYGTLTAAWLWRQVQKHRSGQLMNWPKLALLATVVPLQWLALLHASQYGSDGIIRAGIALGLFHSFQYHRLLWFHNKNRYGQPGAGARFGLAASLASSSAAYFAVAVGLHFLLMFLPQVVFRAELLSASIWGFSFAHYILDGKIWHVKSDRELATALQMA